MNDLRRRLVRLAVMAGLLALCVGLAANSPTLAQPDKKGKGKPHPLLKAIRELREVNKYLKTAKGGEHERYRVRAAKLIDLAIEELQDGMRYGDKDRDRDKKDRDKKDRDKKDRDKKEPFGKKKDKDKDKD